MDSGKKLESAESTESSGVPEVKVYKRRWYILGVFSLLACHQCAVWNTWGPIANTVQFAYKWSDGTVAMMANWGTIMFVLAVAPLTWFIEVKGLRPTVVLVGGLYAGGTILRYAATFSQNSEFFLASCHICSILNGISGVTVMAAPPLISSHWFPPNERTTATAINLAANMLGNGFAMLVGPAVVDYQANKTTLQESIKGINNYMLIDAVIAAVIFILFLVYYPSKPSMPPAATSIIQRTGSVRGLRSLLSNRHTLAGCFAYSISEGVMGAWMSVMVLNLQFLNISEAEIGYIGLASVLGQCLGAVLVGFFTDRLRKRMKVTLLVLLSLASLMFIWLMLMCIQAVPSTTVNLYLAIVGATTLTASCLPIFFELCVEIAYPINESLVGGFLTASYNLVSMVFLFIFFIPNIGYIWVNYVLVASTILAIPALLLTQERYNRSSVDDLISSVSEKI